MLFFKRKGEQDGQADNPGPLLPGEKGIGENQRDASAYLSKALRPDGRIKGTSHPLTSLRDIKLSPDSSQAAQADANATVRGNMMRLMCDTVGKPLPQGFDASAQGDEGVNAAIDGMLAEYAGKMKYPEFNAALAKPLHAALAALSEDEPARMRFHQAANKLRARARGVLEK